MNKKVMAVFCAGLITGAATAAGAFSLAGSASAVVKNSSKVLLENDQVRVKEAIFAPGEKPGMHTHDLPHVGVIIDGGTLKFNSPDGKSETLQLKRGDVGYREANVTHEPIKWVRLPCE
ncbi:MAG TPA: hypothetical protein VG778_02560 [Blastocatellia bacterium]|nr:hypothetical protein [Blastocatellia bacterium]